MKGFVLTNAAKTDLKKIAKYTHDRWGRDQRNFYIRQFDKAFHLLAGTPNLGKSCDHIRKGYRSFPLASHLIFYRQESEIHIQIVRILHQSMDVELKLKKG